jgi:hypothetical protein
MHRSDRIYLSKFEQDPNPEYLDLDNFDLNCEPDRGEFYDEIILDNEKNFSTVARRLQPNED